MTTPGYPDRRFTQLVVLLFVYFFLSPLQAQTKERDLRKTADADGLYSLSFCARPSPDSGLAIPPHAFVSWSQLPTSGKRAYKAVGTVAGVQPKALVGFSKSISPVPVELTQGDYVSLMERCLNLLVSKTDYQRALRLGQSSLAQIASTIPSQPVSAVYSLPPEECLTMFVGVMKLFGNRGIALPPRRGSELPLAYMRRLVEQNATVRSPQ